MWGETTPRQAVAEMNRGGGERGSMERGKSKGFANSIGDLIAVASAATAERGSTKAIEATSERSESWQQAIEQAIIPVISCPQSMCLAGEAGVFW
jgi:hypothetical protein